MKKKSKTTKRSERKEAPKRTEKNRGVHLSTSGGISEDYARFIDGIDLLNLRGEISLTRRFIGELAVLADEALTSARPVLEDNVEPENRRDALTDVYKRVGKISTSVNNFLKTLDRLVRTVADVAKPTGVIPIETAQKYLETILDRYYSAVRANINDPEVVGKVVDCFLRSMGFDAQYLKPILNDIEDRYRHGRHLPASGKVGESGKTKK